MFYVNYQTETSLTALADKADSIISFNDNICQIQENIPTFQRKQLKEQTINIIVFSTNDLATKLSNAYNHVTTTRETRTSDFTQRTRIRPNNQFIIRY